MTTNRTIDQFMRKAKGKALELRGRATGDRRTAWRGRMIRMRGEAQQATRRLSRNLRRAAHR